MDLRPADFSVFFRAIHGCEPFPWQQSLVDRIAATDAWPEVLDLPTGSGKTAALDAAVFHLALRADAPGKAALRIALVVDRRLVVDDAHARAQRIARALQLGLQDDTNTGEIVVEVAQRLQRLAGQGRPPLVAQRLRGGAPLERDWALTPTQPTLLCSTVDQVGSRLLFRGYGVSDRMKPVHAGLLGSNSLILLDEAHLAEPFRQTLQAVQRIGKARIDLSLLSATPGKETEQPFTLTPEDRADPVLKRRLEARKPARLRRVREGAAREFAMEARKMAVRLGQQGIHPAAVGIVVNRVALARDVFCALESGSDIDSVLMIGRSRDVDRSAIAEALKPFRTGEANRQGAKSLFIVATQCLEVGVDVDLDGLVTQAAPLDALRQRFGRLNRAGRPIRAEGVVIARAEDIKKKADDPVYGDRIRTTWEALESIADEQVVDFGVEALPPRLQDADINPDDIASERPNAPVLMPAYLDLWSQTSPRPAADPEVALFLHGVNRTAAGVSIVWRSDISEADINGRTDADPGELLRLIPPRTAEAVELPLWVAREWLCAPESDHADVSDAPERENTSSESEVLRSSSSRRAFRWAGHEDPATGIVEARDLIVGDLLVVPTGYGGCDRFGWAPQSSDPAIDVADEAARPYRGRHFAVRITPDIHHSQSQWDRIVASEHIDGSELVDLLLASMSSTKSADEADNNSIKRDVRSLLEGFRRAKGRIDLRFPYAGGRSGGVVLVAESGIDQESDEGEAIPATEDETASHASDLPVLLDDHGRRVEKFAMCFARTLGLAEDVATDLSLAAYLHDAGKADARFQTMLSGGDPWNSPDGPPLAKSGRPWSPQGRARVHLPPGWRHEALSVRMARTHSRMSSANDPALVLWLIGSHHGWGRPFFKFHDPASQDPPHPCLGMPEWRLPRDQVGPQSLAYDFEGVDWPNLFEHLKRHYGIWELAHMEAILRLADHRASEEERNS